MGTISVDIISHNYFNGDYFSMATKTTTVVIKLTTQQLLVMYDNDLAIWRTPNASNVYIASQPSFAYDKGISVGTILDILSDELGYEIDIDDLRNTDDELHTVTLVFNN